MGRTPARLFLILAPPAFGLLTLAFGMDANWDLRNYHYYNAYAFLTGREGYDLLAAQAPTFFNPLIDVPFFVATQLMPARLVGFLLGTVQGLNTLPLYGIACSTLAIEPIGRRRLIAAGLALFGMVGVGQLSELGTTFYDNVVSLGGLAALWLILRRLDLILHGSLRSAWPSLLLAGFAAGLAAGLKQPIVTLALGLCLALLATAAPIPRRIAAAFLFGIGTLIGLAAGAGYWMAHLWHIYGNPLFPFYNQIFRSPWALPEDYHQFFYIPAGFWTRVFFPFAYLIDPQLTGNVAFRDVRILVCFVLVPLAAIVALAQRLRARPTSTPVSTTISVPISFSAPAETRYLLWAFAIGYVFWVLLFCIYRYLIAYEMLAPLVILLAIGSLPLSARARAGAVLISFVLVTAAMGPNDWIRVPWSEKWVSAQVPTLADPDRTVVLITGHEPLAYLIPFFPPGVRFLRIHSGFSNPTETDVRFNDEMHRIVERQEGPLFVLFNPNETVFAEKYLPYYRLAIERAGCTTVPSNIGYLPYLFCPLKRTS